jgi:Leucine-rich repeat (LRR) protein
MKQIKAYFGHYITFALTVFLTFPLQAQVSSIERQALIDLYNATNGNNWKNTVEGNQPWLINDPNSLVSDWYGITVAYGKVTELKVGSNNLNGEIPGIAINKLVHLEVLSLANNQLSGNIPSEIGLLVNLKKLYLHSNKEISGMIPKELGGLINLQVLHIYNTKISGAIPKELGQLKNLETLTLYYNNLTESIPRELGKLTNLKFLYLGSNRLEGSIPPELGQLVKLQRLDLFHNILTGSIPKELGKLQNLLSLTIGKNKLTGSIPIEFNELMNFNLFRIDGNNFVFSDLEPVVDTYITKLGDNFKYISQTKVDQTETLSVMLDEDITLTSTSLTSTNNSYQWYKNDIPIEGAKNKNLVISNATDSDAGVYHFTVTNEKVPGLTLTRNPITVSINSANTCKVSAIEKQALIDLYSSTDGANWTNNTNWLSATVPVCNWYGVTVVDGKVTKLDLEGNELTGKIPTSFGDLVNLTLISFSINKLSGALPDSIGNLVNVETFNIERNSIIGPIPISIGDMSALKVLILSSNLIGGEIPSSIGRLFNLTTLNLYKNELVKSIPYEIGNLLNLINLNLFENKLTGEIPSTLGNLKKLTTVHLYNNELTGSIPRELGNLSNLSILKISSNHLSGKIPSELAVLTISDVLNELRFEHNDFVFSDFELDFPTYKKNLKLFTYNTQNKVDQAETRLVTIGQSITLSSTALTSSNNVYQWYKNNAAIEGATNKDLVISNATDSDAGVYYFTATNKTVTNLTLTRNPITLEVASEVNELEVTINTKDLPNSEFDIVLGSTTIPGVISGNADSETLVNLGSNTGENKTVLINVKPSQNARALHLRFIANTSGISNIQVSSGGNWLDFSPEFYRIEGSTIYFMNKKNAPVVPFTINLINGVQYDSSVPLTINVNNSIDLTGATVEIFSPSNGNIVVQPSASINGFVLDTTLTEVGSYTFIMKIQNKSFKGHFLVAGSAQTGNGSF